MKELFIIGTAYEDNLFYINKFLLESSNNICTQNEYRLGGIYNTERYITIHNQLIELKYYNSIIIINKENGSRTSIVKQKDKEVKLELKYLNDLWIHIMYLDCLDKINDKILKKLKQQGCTISVDFCLGEHTEQFIIKLRKMEKYIDYIITSDKEAKSIGRLNANNEVLIHSPHNVYLANSVISIHNSYYKPVINNSLGMGDYFAGLVIEQLIKGKCVTEAVIHTQKKLSKIAEKN